MSVVANVAINVDARDASAKLRQFQQQSSAAAKAAQDLQKTTDATGAALEKQSKAAGKAAGALRGLGGIIASIGAGALVAGMVRGAAAAEQLQLRLKLLSAEYGETARVQQFVSESAKTFGQSQMEAAGGVADVYARLRPLGVSLNQIEAIYKGFNATALASGTSAEAASGAFLQLSQALGSGTLQGDEFRSIAEQVPGILRLVAGEMGVTVGELKKLGSEGKITSDILISALARGFDENSSKVKTLLDQSPAQRFKEFKDATQELSNAIGSQLLPAITPVVKLATELLRLFGSLPGPVQTLIAAVLGLTAAFVALAPPITAVIGLLGSAGIAGLIAAGPWIALAAGITAATVALAGYRTESQRVSQSLGAKARGGAAGDLARAQNRAVELQQEISLAQRQQAGRAGGAGGGRGGGGGQRGAAGTSLASKRAELAQLQRDIAQGQQAAPVTTGLPSAVTKVGAGTGAAGGGGGGGKSKAEEAAREAEKLRQELERSLEVGDQLGVQFGRQVALLFEGNELEQKRLQIQFGYEDRAKQIAELKNAEQRENLTALNTEIQRLELIDLQTEALKKQAEEAQKLFDQVFEATVFGVSGGGPIAGMVAEMQESFDDFISPLNQVKTAAVAIGGAFSESFKDIITGAKSAQQAISDFFGKIGEALIDYATQAIAQYIAIGIARMFAGLDPLANANKNLSGTGALSTGKLFSTGAFAEGGFVTGPTRALIGEGGEPEYVIPASKMRSAMGRYAGGARGAAVIPGNGESGGGGMGAAPSGTIDVRYSIERINNVDYVTADQFQRGMAQAAQQGAIQGERRAMRTLGTSPATRRRIGI